MIRVSANTPNALYAMPVMSSVHLSPVYGPSDMCNGDNRNAVTKKPTIVGCPFRLNEPIERSSTP